MVDDGPGFPRDKVNELMEAFYTTKSHGTGLGLAVVQAVVKAHNGQFSLAAMPRGGACASIRLPAARTTTVPHNQNTHS